MTTFAARRQDLGTIRFAYSPAWETTHAARMFIDQLEMIEVKTKGNLDKNEDQLLKQSLTTLRMAFVEAVNSPAPDAAKAPSDQPAKAAADTAQGATAGQAAPPPQEESHKKFSKKY